MHPDILRLAVACLNSQDDVILVLRNQRLLSSDGLTARADRSEAERSSFQSLLDQVNQHNETHPDNKHQVRTYHSFCSQS